MTGSLYWFERKYLLNSQVRITLVCQSLFWGKKVFLVKWASARLKQLCCVFPWDQSLTLGVQQECFMHTSSFVTENVKKIRIQGLRFHKILFFYVFIKDILSETGIFPLQMLDDSEEALIAAPKSPLWFVWRQEQFFSPLSCIFSTNFNRVEETHHILILL